MSTKSLFVIFVLISSCSSFKKLSDLTKSEKVEYYTILLKSARPLLNSDELPYMDCKKLNTITVEEQKSENSELWKKLGSLALREKAQAEGGNILAIRHKEFGNVLQTSADVYQCKKINKVSIVDIAGMCKPSESKVFTIKYDPEELRQIGEEILKTNMEYYALSNHYRSFHFRDIKYRYTKKEFTGKAYFFKCY